MEDERIIGTGSKQRGQDRGQKKCLLDWIRGELGEENKWIMGTGSKLRGQDRGQDKCLLDWIRGELGTGVKPRGQTCDRRGQVIIRETRI